MATDVTDAPPYVDPMGDEPEAQADGAAEDRSNDGADGVDDEVADDIGHDDIVEEIVEERSEPETAWIADGEKYRCPVCEAVHAELTGGCSVCGWAPG